MIICKHRETYRGPGIHIGPPHPLANPFKLGQDGTARQVLHKYRHWLTDQLTHNTPARNQFNELKALHHQTGYLILCDWCLPEPSYAHIVKAALEDDLPLHPPSPPSENPSPSEPQNRMPPPQTDLKPIPPLQNPRTPPLSPNSAHSTTKHDMPPTQLS